MKALLVDDHALFREGLVLLMQQRFPEVTLTQAHSLGRACEALGAQPDTDLVLLDLNLPDARGLGSLKGVRAAAPEVPVVVLSADDSAEMVDAVIAAGASGYIPKTARGGVIVQALAVVLEGGVYLPPEALRAVRTRALASRPGGVDAAASPGNDLDLYAAAVHETFELSRRQVDVLRWLIEGKSNKAIARELDIAESSVKSHLKAIFKKLDVNSRAEAVLLAVRHGMAGLTS